MGKEQKIEINTLKKYFSMYCKLIALDAAKVKSANNFSVNV